MTVEGKHGDDTPPTDFNPWRDIVLAITFLTRLPLPMDDLAFRPLARAAWAFPVAGIMTGGVGGGVFYGAVMLDTPLLIAVALGLAASIMLSGGLHEDGLADVADGFGGGATREKKLEIMHDSRIGTYGVLALVFSVGLRVTAFTAIAEQAGVQAVFAAFLAIGILSRGLLPAVMTALPNARENGLSKAAGRPGVAGVAVSLVLGFIGAAIPFHANYGPVAVAVSGAVAAVFVLCLIAKRQIGGQTGDVIGAAQQVGEVAFLIVLCISLGGNP